MNKICKHYLDTEMQNIAIIWFTNSYILQRCAIFAWSQTNKNSMKIEFVSYYFILKFSWILISKLWRLSANNGKNATQICI